eukprot:3831019-Pleurochrysis_carterae.AAC.1
MHARANAQANAPYERAARTSARLLTCADPSLTFEEALHFFHTLSTHAFCSLQLSPTPYLVLPLTSVPVPAFR